MVRSLYANLYEHFHLKPWDVARLTDRQIIASDNLGQTAYYYFHPRNEKNEIEPVPDPPRVTAQPESPRAATLGSELMGIDILIGNKVISREDGEACKEKLRAKYAAAAQAKVSDNGRQLV